jgi:hypothetical protein
MEAEVPPKLRKVRMDVACQRSVCTLTAVVACRVNQSSSRRVLNSVTDTSSLNCQRCDEREEHNRLAVQFSQTVYSGNTT